MSPAIRYSLSIVAAMALAACGGSGSSTGQDGSAPGGGDAAQLSSDACAAAAYPSAEWTQCQLENFAIVSQAPAEQALDPNFLLRWQEQGALNFIEFTMTRALDPLWQTTGNLCETWGEPCTGDPFRYPGVDPFYDEVGEVIPVNFYDQGGARISGRVWAPVDSGPDDALPAVVIINGSVQAPETLYWWAAQLLVENGYLAMTFDPRGQGRSDNATPDGELGSNFNSAVFRRNLIDAIDFFYSTPDDPYRHNLPGMPGPAADGGAADTSDFNPLWQRFDRDRLGVAGHSLGATGVSVVQGENPWPGMGTTDLQGATNPIDATVAWDNLSAGGELDGVMVTPRVPAMGQSADYSLVPTPYTEPPDPEEKRAAFNAWRQAGLPTYQVTIRGGSHYEWSLLPGFPTSSWCPDSSDNRCDGGWGQPLAQHYTLAWFDRWLKESGEPGFDDADDRLLIDSTELRERMSFYHLSSRDFPTRDGDRRVCLDIRSGC